MDNPDSQDIPIRNSGEAYVVKEHVLVTKFKYTLSRSKQLEGEKKVRTWRKVLDISTAILVRAVFLIEAILSLYYIIGVTNSYYFLFFIPLLIVIVLDGLYVSLFRHGKEHTWYFVFSIIL
jgi:hypothetical protein